MEPRIQYAKTSDGVSIAFCEAGEGQTLVRVPPVPWSHAQREWETFPYFLYIKSLAETCRIAWYDSRGSGLSDRDALDFSMDAMVRDMDAVLTKLGAEKFALCALSDGVPVAISYAARRPERVSHLVLVDGYTKGSQFLDTPAGQFELGTRGKDWVLYSGTLARLFWGQGDRELEERLAEHIRACSEPEALSAAYDAVNYQWDVTDVLPSIVAQTLVLHNQNLPWLPMHAGQRLAADIPNSRFLAIDDRTYSSVPGLVAEFLGLRPVPTVSEPPSSGTAIILFADIADSTGMTERLGDTAFRERGRDLDEALRRIVTNQRGTPIDGKLLGDGVLATFRAASQGIAAALACASAGDERGLPLHLGLHAGDVIREEGNVFGGAVNIAARISALSSPGEVLVSRTVADLARTSAGVSFEDRGEHELKGIAEPQRLFAVTTLG